MLSSLVSTAPSLTWLQADDDLFVATRRGEYAGFISRAGDCYEAHSGRGDLLGARLSAEEAASALEHETLQPA